MVRLLQQGREQDNAQEEDAESLKDTITLTVRYLGYNTNEWTI